MSSKRLLNAAAMLVLSRSSTDLCHHLPEKVFSRGRLATLTFFSVPAHAIPPRSRRRPSGNRNKWFYRCQLRGREAASSSRRSLLRVFGSLCRDGF